MLLREGRNFMEKEKFILDLVRNFPIGEVPKNREELLSKVSIIAYLS